MQMQNQDQKWEDIHLLFLQFFHQKIGIAKVLDEKFLPLCVDFLHYCGPGSGKILKRSSLHKLCHM